jgi:hypothetical protein
MKRQTRKILLNVATGIAIAATAAVMLMPATASAQQNNQPSIGFGFGVGPNGPNVQFGVNNNPPPRSGRPPRPREVSQVCFFENSRLRGDSFCMDEGSSIRDLRDWDGEISSFDNPDGLDVTVCTRTNFRGSCRTYTSSARSLGSLDDEIASVRLN